jgi:hypothetical protein
MPPMTGNLQVPLGGHSTLDILIYLQVADFGLLHVLILSTEHLDVAFENVLGKILRQDITGHLVPLVQTQWMRSCSLSLRWKY